MHILLRHPVHGTKIAISEIEAEADKENGWVADGDNQTTTGATNELETQRRRRRRSPD